jgi:acetyltransferase-like isoleucine patch superfamily enzyme
MTEREKCHAGLLYTFDEELHAEATRAKDLCFAFNHTPPSNKAEREGILRSLLGRMGAQVHIVGPFYCDLGSNIEIGDHFFANFNFTALDCGKIKIGDHVQIGPNVGLYTPEHPLDIEQRRAWLETAGPITIEDDVWIGGGVTVLGDVTIGARSVIGAGSVVTKSIPADCIAVGSPCRVVKLIPSRP